MISMLLSGSLGSQLDLIFSEFDYSVFQFMGGIQDQFLTVIAKLFTALGTSVFVALIAVMGLVMIFFKRTRRVGIALVFAVIIGTLITNVVVKPLVLRIRPYNTLQHDLQYWGWYVGAGMTSESDYCFPSGHTTGFTEIAIALMLVHATSKRKSAKAFCWLFPVIAIFVGASRIYLMVHYATDVIAGFIVGSFAGVAGYLIAFLICRRYRDPEDTETQNMLRRNLSTPGIIAIILASLVIYTLSVFYARSSGGEDSLRCAYHGDYDCQNEVEEKDEYLGPDGQYYCDIHQAELFGN